MTNIIPFGKYKGRLIDEVLLDDPNYLQWLSGQDWFRDKFNVLYQVIINRGAEPEETPEHNAMQVRFLDDEFCWRFLRWVISDLDSKLATARENLNSDASRFGYETENIKIKKQFEVQGRDVLLTFCTERLNEQSFRSASYPSDLPTGKSIELKPLIGDDYPAVLRQMRANHSNVLLVGVYNGKGATEQQFVQTFAVAGIKVVFERELTEHNDDDAAR